MMLAFRASIFDIRRNFVNNRVIIVALLAYVLFEVGSFIAITNSNDLMGVESGGFSALDLLVFLNKGVKEHDSHSNALFLLDFGWMIPQLLIGLSVCLRSVRDYETYAIQTISRIKSRTMWFVEKIVWALVLTTGFYLAMIAISWIAAILFGDAHATGLTLQGAIVVGVDASKAECCAVWAALALGYVATLAGALLMTALSLVVGPIWSYFILVICLIASSFFNSYLLFYEFAMVMRNSVFTPTGFSTPLGISICCVIIVLSIGWGFFVSRKVEYL